LDALEAALCDGSPEIFNTDQGVQYTAEAFTGRLEAAGVRVSMDGRGRWMGNVFVERLWRTVKYEHLYLHDYATPRALEAGLSGWFPSYNVERIHSSLDYRTPMAVYLAMRQWAAMRIIGKFLETNWKIKRYAYWWWFGGRASPRKGLTGRQSPLSKNSRLLV
jgi:transposase InsO family protein